MAIFLSVIYFFAITVLSYYQYLSANLLLVFFAFNGISFLLYALDKYKAKQGYWRIKETTLHFVSLLGGWPGAALAQQLLKHKNRKAAFQVRYWLTIIANITVLTSMLYFYHGTNHYYS
ncbi:DUF1294 domain-containing protein [Colwellia psychrerythraea]|uniref:DUF1294 domain-containing protein n=1 Tax=Colwellia psychrerythraea TaxID=28229 RepID=UPI001E464B92|nr:DUF1294 domain-containing protein [Colwellia psychrerythraea]